MTSSAVPPAAAPAAGTITLAGDLTVNRMGFGAMRITGPGVIGWPEDREGAKAVLRRAIELGVNFIDTADSYGPEVSELLIAEALHPYPDDVVIATKGGLIHRERGEWTADGRPEHLREACESSLGRLRLEQIHVYQLHRPDPKVPLEESVGALAELRDAGKIRHVGLSNVDTDQLSRAREIVPVVSVQNRFSLFERTSEDVLQACEREGLAFLPWFPLAAGNVEGSDGPLQALASLRGATPAQVALAWLLHRSPAMLPIPGTSSIEHLEENMRAAALELSNEEISALEAA